MGETRCPPKRPERLMADRDYNSHSLRVRLARCGMAPSIPAGGDVQTDRAGWVNAGAVSTAPEGGAHVRLA